MTDTFEASQALHAAPWETADTPAEIVFGQAPGNRMSPAWAAYVLRLWHQANGGKLSFADAMKQAVVHFMVEGES